MVLPVLRGLQSCKGRDLGVGRGEGREKGVRKGVRVGVGNGFSHAYMHAAAGDSGESMLSTHIQPSFSTTFFLGFTYTDLKD